MLTYDGNPYAQDGRGNQTGQSLGGTFRTHDGRTCDSTGAFLVGELERLDQKMHRPLAAVTWSRDLDLRQDVTIADEVSSFTTSTYGSPGGLGTGSGIGTGKAWVGRDTTQITGISVDIAKIPHPLRPWSMEIKYTIFELESAARVGRPIDAQKLDALQLKHQMDIDEQAYYGDLTTGDKGLVNSAQVTAVTNLPNGQDGTPQWSTKTPVEILDDFNLALTTTWENAAWAVMPTRALIPPSQFGYISTTPVTIAGTGSILKYLMENNLLVTSGVGKMEIYPAKWCIGSGVGGTIGVGSADGGIDRMVIYSKDVDRVRFPMTLLNRTPVQYDGLYHKSTYFTRLGVVEVVYPETISYWDGL